MIRMTKQRATGQLRNLRGHCCEMSGYGGHVWKNDIAALDVAIECLKNDRNEIIKSLASLKTANYILKEN